MRIVTNIFAGIAAGILGLGLFEGLLWWAVMGVLTSVLLWIKLQTMDLNTKGDNSKFFSSIFEAAFSGFISNFAIFFVGWVMFYNIIYVI